jgi:hypothetical protein
LPHYTTGLPANLNLEPFDPTPLYAAARSPRRDKDQPAYKPSRRPVLLVVAMATLLATAAGVAAYLFV